MAAGDDTKARKGVRVRHKKSSGSKRSVSYERLMQLLMEFSDARAVIEVVCRSMEEDDCPVEAVALRSGLRMLDRVYDELDRGIIG